ncbi:MAG: HAD-IA family hydrolase [Candidatus Omnitrophica bacterium]|nr:HAD-IA family hydrolase [Candidatus Omnitrophota bacterium]
MATLRTVVLDFDGVLVESVGIKDQAFEEIFSEFPEHFDRIMRYHLARNATIRYEKFKHIWTEILGRPYSVDVEQELCGRYERRIVDKIIQCPEVTGASDFLSFLSKKMPLYIVSMNPLEELRSILRKRGFLSFFRDVYAFPWKKKDALADILKKEGLTAQQCVFIGDTPEDHMAAKENGLTFIGRQSNRKLSDDIPVFKTLTDIQNFLVDQYNIYE